MLNYIETHGVEALIICYIFSLLMSTVPKLPEHTNFFLTWLYNFAQILGANASNLVKNTPTGQKIEKFVSESQTITDTGTIANATTTATTNKGW